MIEETEQEEPEQETPEQVEPEQPTLEDCYKFVYHCDKCGTDYGSDKQELNDHTCPICENKTKL